MISLAYETVLRELFKIIISYNHRLITIKPHDCWISFNSLYKQYPCTTIFCPSSHFHSFIRLCVFYAAGV